MHNQNIVIKGARAHNLKNIDIAIPKNKLVVITGLSGSGKSSLAFDTVYAEGQRRYVESLSSYARQFMEVKEKPAIDSIEGLSPTIAIDQKVATQNPRSTVGTVTEIYDFLRLLFARAGKQYCPQCHEEASAYKPGEIVEEARKLGRANKEILILAPLLRQAYLETKELLEKIEKTGFEMVRVDGKLCKINDFANCQFKPNLVYNVEIVVAKITNIKKQDLVKPVNTALDFGNGLMAVLVGNKEYLFSVFGLCLRCGKQLPELDVRSFSFNSPFGACPRCTGLGVTMEVDPELVIPNSRLSLSEGAVQPWMRITGNQNYYQKILKAVADKFNFSVNTPVAELSSRFLDLVLYGVGNEMFEVDGKKTVFSGVIPDLLKRHLETNSEYIRKEIEQYMKEKICPVCQGKRLRAESLNVKVGEYNIANFVFMNIDENLDVFKRLRSNFKNEGELKNGRAKVVDTIIKEMAPRLENLQKVGLGYLSLDRAMNSLSGGEITRVRLASQLSSGLTGVIYILDEPTVGLHPKDNQQLIATLRYLRDLGNSVLVVEHDRAMMEAADYIIDVGPGAGIYGGEIVAQGALADIKKNKNSLTGRYLAGKETVYWPGKNTKKSAGQNKVLSVVGACAYNLKNVNINIPLGKLVCVTGVSGSGKSTLIVNILARALSQYFYRAKDEPGPHKAIKGIENIDKVISIDQTPIGRTPRSNPATYTGLFTLIRDLFADIPEARLRGYDAGKFSFNVKGGGRCEACAGEGYSRIPMQFLADVYVECNECGGSRYNKEALEIHYKEKNIADILNMTVEEAYKFFSDVSLLADKLNVLRDVGLGYAALGQPATTLSGGEAQRIKLSTELMRISTGKTLYIFDEPTTGLHFEDIKRLLGVLRRLVEKGNTVLVIEHHLDIIRSVDWVIELGPEGGKKGGHLVAEGTPEMIMKNKHSATGKFLK